MLRTREACMQQLNVSESEEKRGKLSSVCVVQQDEDLHE